MRVDAGPSREDGTIEVTGKKAEILMPGETKWQPLAAGAGELTKGAKSGSAPAAPRSSSRTASRSRWQAARAPRSATTSRSRVELGVGTAAVDAQTSKARSACPAAPSHQGPERAAKRGSTSTAKGDAKIAVLEGTAKLTGSGGADLDDEDRRERIAREGRRDPSDREDPRLLRHARHVGDDAGVHDSRSEGLDRAAVQLQRQVHGGGTIELDNDPKFQHRAHQRRQRQREHHRRRRRLVYRLVCGSGATGGSGHITVRRDAGTRPLPKDPPVNSDRRRRPHVSHLVSVADSEHQGQVPGRRHRSYTLHLATGGSEEKFESKTNSITIEGKKLKEATYTFWVDKDGTKLDKISTLIINFDQTAPQVYIESPANGKPFGAEIDVRGAVLPGWTAKVDVVEIPVDKSTRRFNAKVAPPTDAQALAIRLSHPQRGVHYYLRRGK